MTNRVCRPDLLRPLTTRSNTPPPAFVILSFEGPDDYARAGGLGARVSGLAYALAEEGFETHLFFVGAPAAPGLEITCGGNLYLHRWCQWISHYYPGGVYDGEEHKLADWNASLPAWVENQVLAGLVATGRAVVVIAEEWQTSWSVARLAARALERGWREQVQLFWNANNGFGFDRMQWRVLSESVTITTVSRFMKHEMWRYGVDARVLPNGIAQQWLNPCDQKAVTTLKQLTKGKMLLAKIARWDPDKRWLMAVDAVGDLKKRGLKPVLLARGGMEQHGREVLVHARCAGLHFEIVRCGDDSPSALCQAVASAPPSDILVVDTTLSRLQLQCIYRASNAVLANSGIEPFGLVGLEAMASGAVAFVGATGEDYARPGQDAISLQSSSPEEISSHLLRLRAHPEFERRLRREARRTAARYTWGEVIRTHVLPLVS